MQLHFMRNNFIIFEQKVLNVDWENILYGVNETKMHNYVIN